MISRERGPVAYAIILIPELIETSDCQDGKGSINISIIIKSNKRA